MNPPRQGNSDDASLQSRFQSVVRSVVVYLQARHRLWAIEAGEAKEVFSRKLCLVLVALVFLVLGYMLIVVGAMMMMARLAWAPWPVISLLVGLGHLLVGAVVWAVARRSPKEPFFQETLNELEKDREWLSSPQKPWK